MILSVSLVCLAFSTWVVKHMDTEEELDDKWDIWKSVVAQLVLLLFRCLISSLSGVSSWNDFRTITGDLAVAESVFSLLNGDGSSSTALFQFGTCSWLTLFCRLNDSLILLDFCESNDVEVGAIVDSSQLVFLRELLSGSLCKPMRGFSRRRSESSLQMVIWSWSMIQLQWQPAVRQNDNIL